MALKIATLDLSTERKYTLVSDENEDIKTSFFFKPMSIKKITEYMDRTTKMSISDNSIYLGNSTINLEVFKAQIKNWENIFDEKGEEIKIKLNNGYLTEEQANIFPPEIINEVANHIVNVSKVSSETLEK